MSGLRPLSTGSIKNKNYDTIMKILLVGDSGVGKSCLLVRFVDDKFNPTFITTIGIDFKIKTVEINGKKVKLQLWDTAGQERFRTITTAYYRGAMGIIIVYDVTDERTFSNVRQWYQTVTEHANENAQILLVGNKNDMDNRVVSYEQGEKLATELNVTFIESSAKDNRNVDQIFLTLAKLNQNNLPIDNGNNTNNININDFKGNGNGKTNNCC